MCLLTEITITYDQVNGFCSKIISDFPATITNNHTVALLICVLGTCSWEPVSHSGYWSVRNFVDGHRSHVPDCWFRDSPAM